MKATGWKGKVLGVRLGVVPEKASFWVQHSPSPYPPESNLLSPN
jgi:hypothetical protein